MKKKVLFVINSLTIGGSEKSLISLLNTIDFTRYSVDLFMLKKGEEFDRYIPSNVNVLDEPCYYEYLNNTTNNISIFRRLIYFRARLMSSIGLRINLCKKRSINSEQVLYKNQRKIFDEIDKQYDIAIAYSQGVPTYFVADKVKAKKKIAWINCDYATSKYDKNIDEKYYEKFDNIVAVSKSIKKSIIAIKPIYEKKIKVILDIVNPKLIEVMSEEKNIFEDKSYLNILTVARLVIHHKGYDIAIESAKILKENKYKFKWFVVGDGPDKKKIINLIKKHNVEDCFILLGKKDNPYPYMKNCDIYVQPSKKEGFGLTVVEAKILKKPIVCTNFNTANEIINHNLDGVISEMNPEKLSLDIRRYIDDVQFRNKIENALKINQYSSVKEIEKIYSLLK